MKRQSTVLLIFFLMISLLSMSCAKGKEGQSQGGRRLLRAGSPGNRPPLPGRGFLIPWKSNRFKFVP